MEGQRVHEVLMPSERAYQFSLLAGESMLAHLSVGRRAEQLPVGNDELEHFTREAVDLFGLLRLLEIPPVNLPVAAGGKNLCAVRGVSDGEDRLAVAQICAFQFAGPGVEQARGFVAAGRRQLGTVGSKGQCCDPVGMLLDEQFELPATGVENTDGVVRATRCQPCAVRAERQSQHQIG